VTLNSATPGWSVPRHPYIGTASTWVVAFTVGEPLGRHFSGCSHWIAPVAGSSARTDPWTALPLMVVWLPATIRLVSTLS
jgi:hypothetical protein